MQVWEDLQASMSDRIMSYQSSPIRSTLFWPGEDGNPSVHISLGRSVSGLPSSLSDTTGRPSNASKESCRVIRATPESTDRFNTLLQSEHTGDASVSHLGKKYERMQTCIYKQTLLFASRQQRVEGKSDWNK